MDRFVRRPRRWGAAPLLLLVALLVGATGCHWTMLGAGPTRTSHNVAENTITPGNVASLQTEWTASTGAGPAIWEMSWSPAIANEAVVVGSDDGVVRAFSPAGTTGCGGVPKTCQPLWTATTGGQPLTPTVVDGVVYVTANDTLFTFDVTGQTGCSGTPKVCQPLWTATPANDSPVLVDDVVYVSAGSRIAAYDADGQTACSGSPKTCQPLWSSSPAPCEGLATRCQYSAPSVSGAKVYAVWTGNFGLGQGALAAFDRGATSGCGGTPTVCAPLWQSFVKANAPSPAPSIEDGRVFLYANFDDVLTETSGSWLEAHDATTGALLWDDSYFGQFVYPPTVAEGRVYVPAGFVEIYDAAGVQNCFPRGNTKRCNPIILLRELTVTTSIANGVLYTGTDTIRGYDIGQLTPACGQFGACPPQWTASGMASATSTPVVDSGWVYAHTANGTLHAIGLP